MKNLVSVSRRHVLMGLFGWVAWAAMPGAQAGVFDQVTNQFKSITGQMGTLRVLVVDVSLSPGSGDPKPLYRQGLAAFVNSVQSGDKLLLTSVSDKGMDRLKIEQFSLETTGKAKKDKELKAEVMKSFAAQTEALLTQPGANGSRFIETFGGLAADIKTALALGMAVELLVLADMVESSNYSDFEHAKFTDSSSEVLLKKLSAQKLLLTVPPAPNKPAHKLTVNVVGAGAGAGISDAAVYKRVQRFWEGYFDLCGGELKHYGRTVPKI